MIYLTRLALFACALPAALFAGQTRTWSQSTLKDFEKGVVQNLALRSDGAITLAPLSKEVLDTSSMYLWSLARDSKGNLFTGGSGAKLYRVGPDGKSKMLAEFDALEIHAIAVDSKDRVYVATAPDGKIYRLSADGKPEPFYDPKTKYIWALAFDRQDNLFIATGGQGELHRVTPDGKGKVFFKCEETHVRSLAIDAAGNVIAGTDPGGLVLRVSPAGDGFVLFQMPKREVTAVAVAPDGAIYAAGVGTRSATAPAPAPPPAPAAVSASTPAVAGQPVPRPANAPAALSAAPLGVIGGSDVYRIGSNGDPRHVWASAQDVIYSIAFDAAGRALLGAGNRGNLFRIESPTIYTVLLTLPATQVTALQPGPGGRIYVATGNVGKIYQMGPGLEPRGTLESDVLDSGLFSQWGRLRFEASLNGGGVSIQTRSGNLDQPQKNWSPWSASISTSTGAGITSPASRFVQWKAILTAAGGNSPELDSVDLAYLPKNVEPHVDQIEITAANYRFPAGISVTQIQTLPLPPMAALAPRNERPAATPASAGESPTAITPATISPALQFAKGYLGARWTAGDPNGDSLVYTLEIRGEQEKEWKPLKDKVSEKYYSWDSTAFPDGPYRIRVTASDSPSNPPAEALTGSLVSEPLLIDNTAPGITGLTAARNGAKLEVHWHAADALSRIAKAEYSLDGADWIVAAPSSGISDSLELDYSLSLDAPPGEHTIAIRVEDANANQSAAKTLVR